MSVSTAAAGEGVHEKTIRKYIKERPNWNDFDELSLEQKNAVPGLDEKIITSQQSQGAYKTGRPVQVGNKTFSSIFQAGKAYNIIRRSVVKRINSKNFPYWQWANESNL